MRSLLKTVNDAGAACVNLGVVLESVYQDYHKGDSTANSGSVGQWVGLTFTPCAQAGVVLNEDYGFPPSLPKALRPYPDVTRLVLAWDYLTSNLVALCIMADKVNTTGETEKDREAATTIIQSIDIARHDAKALTAKLTRAWHL